MCQVVFGYGACSRRRAPISAVLFVVALLATSESVLCKFAVALFFVFFFFSGLGHAAI